MTASPESIRKSARILAYRLASPFGNQLAGHLHYQADQVEALLVECRKMRRALDLIAEDALESAELAASACDAATAVQGLPKWLGGVA